MPVSSTSTWDEVPPRRPGLTDIQDGIKVGRDLPGATSDPAKPNANEDNQKSRQIAGVGGITPGVRLWVKFVSGAPVLQLVRAMGSNVTFEQFEVVDTATGQTTIKWPKAAVPPPDMPPAALSLAGACEIGPVELADEDSGATRVVRVDSKVGGVLADVDFCLLIY